MQINNQKDAGTVIVNNKKIKTKKGGLDEKEHKKFNGGICR